MESFLQDLRYAFRRLRKSPGFSAIVILTLALGIGANTAIFSVINTVLLRPLAFPHPERLVTLNHFYPSLNNLKAPVSASGFVNYHENVRGFESQAVETGWGPTLTGTGDPQRLNGVQVSGDWFSVFGVQPQIGRPLRKDEDEPGKNHVVVLSYGLWQRLFGADPEIVSGGRTMTLNNEAFEIVGVMPQSFRDFWNRNADLWTPLALTPAQKASGNEYLNFTGRLRNGVTPDAISSEMAAFATKLKVDFPNRYSTNWSLVTQTLNERMVGPIRTYLFVLLGAVAFVLLIACANVANLMLARAASRQKEVVIRAALGAQRGRLMRELFIESTLLSLMGAVLGLGLAYAGVSAMVAINPTQLPRADEIGLDRTVLLFTLVIAVVTGMLFGLVPAWQAGRVDLQETLKESARGTSAARAGLEVRRTLVVVQMALALALLAGAGLLIKSFSRLTSVDTGFKPDHLLTFSLALPVAKYPNDTSFRAYFDNVIPRIEAVPGVKSVGATSVLPFSQGWATGSFNVEGFVPAQGEARPWGDIRNVTPGLFGTLGLKVLAGRTFGPQDTPSSTPVAVVDDEFVRRYFHDGNAVGKRVTFNNVTDSAVRWIEIVGVVNHTKHEALDAASRIQIYFPFAQNSQRRMVFAVRTQLEPLRMTGAIRAAVQTVDKEQPLAGVQSMDILLDNSVGQQRLSMVLIGTFAAVALALASIGIYGVVSYAVTQRSREMGIRMALGAARSSVLELVLYDGMKLAMLGVLIGVFGGLFLTNLVQGQLYQVDARDPWTFIGVAATLSVIACLATLVPALRATRVNPVEALRND